jgi:UDP-N-acetylmuramate dehydrogenase
LPDPKVIGNAGSFFQNPIVSTEQCEQLSKQFPNLVSYPDSNDTRKLAAGWLIDQCGFKGKRVGPVGVYEKQALVLVNHGGGTSTDILNLAKSIQEEVLEKFGVQLEIEPNIL